MTDFTGLRIFASGTRTMLKEVSQIAYNHAIPTQVFLKERIACGRGICLGCATAIKDPTSSFKHPITGDLFQYKRICTDGPVFEAQEIIWV